MLTNGLLFQGDGASAARWATGSVAEEANVDFEFGEGAAERVAMHTEFARGAALVALVFLENGQDEAFLELADGL